MFEQVPAALSAIQVTPFKKTHPAFKLTPQPAGCPPAAGRLHTSGLQVVAERLLLAAALQSKANQRFLLLSERCLPLYPPGALYAQLMSEQLSRIHACAADSPADQQRRVMHRCVRHSTCLLPNLLGLSPIVQVSRARASKPSMLNGVHVLLGVREGCRNC